MLRVYAMARTMTNDPLLKYKFRVSIPGLPAAMGFNKVSGLKREVETVEYNEGGYDYVHKIPGRETVEAVTLERGIYAGDNELYNLYRKTLTDANFRTTVTIELLDKTGNVQKTWKLAEAWAKTWEGTDFDSTSNDVAIEKLTFEFEYFEE